MGDDGSSSNSKGKQPVVEIVNKKILIGKKRFQRSPIAAKKKDIGICPYYKKKKLFESENDDGNDDSKSSDDKVDPQTLKVCVLVLLKQNKLL